MKYKEERMKKKTLIAIICVLMLAMGSLATLAYFTDKDKVTNTFTVGKVEINLDEAKVDENGNATNIREEVGNEYHLIPGHVYDKDPTLTVLKDSEECYVRMLVTINEQADLNKIFEPAGGLELTTFFLGYNNDWELVKETKDGDTRTYEFRYKTTVAKNTEGNTKLDPLFEQITIPGEFTVGEGENAVVYNIGNAEMESIKDLTVTVVAHAIQADGFTNADDAWAAFDRVDK